MDFDFQDVHPALFTAVGEILGLVAAGEMPFNVQNAIGNWLQLVGQAILTYNAQQQYFQNGPGRYYNPIYRDVGNPFAPTHPSTEVKKEMDELRAQIEQLRQQMDAMEK